MNAKELVQEILKEKGHIDSVFFVACGGSLTDIYNGHYFLKCETAAIRSFWMNASEFLCATPRALSEHSLVIACSHSGNTAESVEAAEFAHQRGAAVVAMTFNKGSKIDKTLPGYTTWIYNWGEEYSEKEKPEGMVLGMLNELLHATEADYSLYDAIRDGLDRIDGILSGARAKVKNNAQLFAQKVPDAPMMYILGSGAAFSQAYAMAICSLMEMQWMDCCYLHSGEYFHGPFEVTGGKTPYVLMMSCGKTRALDERALAFLKKYAGKYEVIDAAALGLSELDPAAADYFNCSLFYTVACAYRDALDYTRRHPLNMRRYMGVVEY